jgi:hypothetical protein
MIIMLIKTMETWRNESQLHTLEKVNRGTNRNQGHQNPQAKADDDK